MKKVLWRGFFVGTFLLVGNLASAEMVNIYPTDDAVAQLYDDDGISDWEQARGFSGDLFREPIITDPSLAIRSDNGVGTYRIYRVSKVFGLPILPEGVLITGAKVKLYKTVGNNRGDIDVVVTSHERTTTSILQKQDWNIVNFGIQEFAREKLLDAQYTEFTLNTEGLDYLNSKIGQPATLGFLTNYDFDNVVPDGFILAAGWYSVESLGTDFDPYLEITYTIPDEEEEFPLYTQGTSTYPSFLETTSWANDSLAGGTAGPHCPTIAACGCAITSAVMLARSYGITKGIDGSDVNPGNFNQWLTTNSGYRPGGNLDFSQAIKYFGTEENGVKKSYFKWKEAPLSGVAVRQKVSSGVPVVSQMKAKPRRSSTENERRTHFVLVTEPLGVGQYGVNDPIWYNTNNLDDDANRTTMVQDYNDQIINGRDLTFVSTAVAVTNALSASLVGRGNALSIASFVRTTALLSSVGQVEGGTAPAEMFMVTPSHERLGIDPRTGQNHTLATGYYGTEAFLSNPLDENAFPVTDVLKTLSASELTSGTYRVIVVGTGGGSYTYSGLVHDSNGREHPFTFTTETAKGMVDTYEFTVETGEVAVLPIDLETFNQVIDGEITDATLNKFFKMWADKIMGEISGGKTLQAKQHIETFRTLLKAKKVNSPAINLLLKKLEAQIG